VEGLFCSIDFTNNIIMYKENCNHPSQMIAVGSQIERLLFHPSSLVNSHWKSKTLPYYDWATTVALK